MSILFWSREQANLKRGSGEVNKYKLSADHKLLIIEHQDSFGGCEHEIKVETVLRILKPVLVEKENRGESELAQTLNPKTGTYVLINRAVGVIVSHHPRKNTPYKGVEVIRR